MKNFIKIIALIFFSQNAVSQNVGIGTSNPFARLHVADSAVVFSASGIVSFNVGNPPISGEGRRMMWYADKAAFRSGYVLSSNWDKDSVGAYSTALGYNNKALGVHSFAAGVSNQAIGHNSMAFGQATVASGGLSTAFGSSTYASGDFSFATGNNTTASGGLSTTMGIGNVASGYASLAMGSGTKSIGFFSTAMGANTTAKAAGSLSVGFYNDVSDNPNPSSLSPDDRIFQIGNGSNDFAKSNAVTVLRNGNSGIGTTTPLARLHVVDSNVLFSSPGFAVPGGNTPVSGAGRRMMWFANKAAFRTGYVDGAQWDADSIGIYSVALCMNNKAKGEASFASGLDNIAAGSFSTAMGRLNNATGVSSTALGQNTIASGNFSMTMGSLTKATNLYSTAMGNGTTANGNSSTSMGNSTVANGEGSLAAGSFTTANGYSAAAIGVSTTSKAYASFVTGIFNDVSDNPDPINPQPTDRIFQIGNGTGAGTSRSNAITVLKNGNTGINTITPLAKLHVAEGSTLFSSSGDVPGSPGIPPISGAGRRMMWYADKAAFRAGYVSGNNWDQVNVGSYSVALGLNNKASGVASFAAGNSNTASGGSSIALGLQTTASGINSIALGGGAQANGVSSVAFGENTVAGADYSTAMGSSTSASSNGSTAMGVSTIASGLYSTATGYFTRAKSHGSFSAGQFNNSSDNPNSFIPQPGDRIFQIGNGDNDATRSNAMTVLRNGSTGIGITSPAATLDVIRGTEAGGTAQFRGTQHVSHFNYSTNEDTYIRAGKDNANVILNDLTGGKVGIGTSAPGSKLHVVYGSSGFAGGYFAGVTVEGNANTYLNFLAPDISESGILFGKASNAASGGIVYNNSANINGLDFRANGNVTKMQIYGSGNAWLQGTLTQNSDVRLKKDIVQLQNSLQKILLLNGYSYYWKNATADNNLQTGVLAQEVQKLFPGLVSENKEGLLAVNYSGLIPVIIESIKEQQKQIDVLSDQNKTQQQQIDELKKLVEKLLKQ